MHPTDAAARALSDGQRTRLYNDRGEILLPVKITDRIMQGVVAVSQGAWFKPDQKGRDRGGNINTLTSQHPTPFAKGNTQHTILAEASAAEDDDE